MVLWLFLRLLVPLSLEHLRERCHDLEESVRLEVIQAIVSAGKKDVTKITDELIECVKDRALDKKVNYCVKSITA